jgi:hypothetical protein
MEFLYSSTVRVVNAKTDLCITDTRSKDERHPGSKTPLAAVKRLKFPSPGPSVTSSLGVEGDSGNLDYRYGIFTTFFKIPVTTEFVQAAQLGQHPTTPTIVATHIPVPVCPSS